MTDALRRAFAVLGLEPDASSGMLREQYLLLAKRWHPDRHGADPVMVALLQEGLLMRPQVLPSSLPAGVSSSCPCLLPS
jgi:hypothetical protein